MKIGVLLDLQSPWSRELALQLADCGHEIHAIDLERSDDSRGYLAAIEQHQEGALAAFRTQVASVTLLPGGSRTIRGYLAAIPMARKRIRALGLDVLLALYGGGYGLLAWASGVRPYGVYVVGTDVLGAGAARRFAVRHVLEDADCVFSNGQYLAARARALAPRARVMPLYIGVDPRRFDGNAGLARGPTVLCTRGFMPVYDNGTVVRALPLVLERVPSARLIFASGGPLLEQTRDLAGQLGCSSEVEFCGGVSDARMVELLGTCSVYVSMARSDGTSIALLEAMCAGVYPILSDIPQNREWLVDALDNITLVPVGDAAALADGIVRALQAAKLRDDAAKLNGELVRSRADLRRNAARLAESLVAVRKAPGGAAAAW